MNYIEVSGTPYQMGFRLGQLFASGLKSLEAHYLDLLNNEMVQQHLANLTAKLKAEFNDGYQEILGRADGADIDERAALLMFFPEITKRIDGCTDVIIKDEEGHFYLSHNEDDINYTPSDVALVKYQYEDHWVISYLNATKLAGSCFSFNSYGMIFTSNYIYDEIINLDYLSRYLLVRKAIEAKNYQETIQILTDIRVASAFSFNFIDTVNNKAFNVEKDLEEVYVTEITERYGRANHFTTKPYDLSKVPASSSFRDGKARELLSECDCKNVSLSQLETILDYEEEDYYRCVYKDPHRFDGSRQSVSVARFSYDGALRKITVTDFLDNRRQLNFDI